MIEREQPILEIGSEKKTATFETTQEFVGKAIKEGAHLIKPSTMSEKTWIRIRNIIGAYAGSPASLEQVAGVTPGIDRKAQEWTNDRLTRERIRQIFKIGIVCLYENSSANLQAGIPKEGLGFDKPLSLQNRIKGSLAHGGLSSMLKDAIQQDASISELKDIAGGQIRLNTARKTLQSWGIDTSYLRTALDSNTPEKALQTETDDQKLQELFGKITIWFYRVYVKGENPLLIPIKNLLKEGGYHMVTHKGEYNLFIEVLERSNIPTGLLKKEIKSGPQKGELIYRFILARHKQRALEALEREPVLGKFLENPVQQVSGPKTAIPTTYEFKNPKRFQSCATTFFKATGKHFGSELRSRAKFRDLLDQNCPVPIFRQRSGGYYCHVSYEKALIEYFRKKWGQIGDGPEKD